MRLIDLDEFLRENCVDRMEGKSCDECKHHALEVSCERLMEQPTIEVVRCGKCRHRYVDGENVRYNVCELNHNKVQSDDWFCADGEVRDG